MSELTQSYVRECFDYNPETGVLRWKVRPRNHFKCEHGQRSFNSKLAGKEAGSEQKHRITGKSYRSVETDGVRYMTHQLICMIVNGYFVEQVDHDNGNGVDNRWFNLNFCGKAENARNQRLRHDNKTGVAGITFNQKESGLQKWRARIAGKVVREGKRFHTLFDAVCWRKSKEIEYGYHENHGEVRPL